MERDALTVLPAPPEGPARISLDPEGFVALRPAPATLARDLAVVVLSVLAVAATFAALVSLATGGWGGKFVCLLFASPAIFSSVALPAGRRLMLALRGTQALRCTPSELVVEYGGGVQRIALADVRRVRGPAAGEVVVDVAGEPTMIEIASDEAQTVWLVEAIRLAADRARRIPEPPERPASLDRLLERER